MHKLFSKKSRRNKILKGFPKFLKIYDLAVDSKKINFRTVLDCLIVDKLKNEAYPLEYKYTKKPDRIYWTLKIQVFAESLLVKEVFGYNIPFAFIKLDQSEDVIKIKITGNELRKVFEIINEVNQIIQTELSPEPTLFVKRRRGCCYWKICKRK